MTIWLDRALVEGEARVSVLDHGFTVGDGVFETLKVVQGVPFALTRHLDRLAESARRTGLVPPADSLLREAVAAVLHSEHLPLGRLRITVTGGPGPAGSDRGGARPTLVLVSGPIEPPPPAAVVVTVPWTRNECSAVAGAKTTSYAENVVALAHARSRGASEALLANTRGRLSEGTGSNVLVEVGGRLVTPPLASGCLAGVTRALALQWCGVVEADIAFSDLSEAPALALTSSTRDIQPVRVLDGRTLSTNGLVQRAAREFTRRAGLDADP